MLVSLRGFNGNRKMILALVVRMLLDKKTRNSEKVEFNKKIYKEAMLHACCWLLYH